MEMAATIVSSLGAEKDSDAQTRFETTSKQSNDPPFSRVNTLGSGEDSIKLMELMAHCTKLSEMVKTVNEEAQIQALVDGKKVIVSETSIRWALHLKDAEGTECLPNATIFCRIGKNEEEVGEGSVNPIDTPHTSTDSQPSTSQHETDEEVTPHSHDLLLSGEDSLKLTELMDLCTKLTDRVLALETTKTTQALEIASLRRRVKKLEKKGTKRTHKLKRLYKIGTTRRVQSFDDESLGAQEDASKQGRSKDTDIILDDATQEDDNLMLDIVVLDKEEVVTTIEKEVSTANLVTTTEITLAQALATMKSLKPKVKDVDSVTAVVPTTPTTAKAKGIVMQESDGTTTKTTTTVPS
ncbi:hypothetical protein Tco_1431946 [Tanacetum coccineum]